MDFLRFPNKSVRRCHSDKTNEYLQLKTDPALKIFVTQRSHPRNSIKRRRFIPGPRTYFTGGPLLLLSGEKEKRRAFEKQPQIGDLNVS